MSSRSLVGIIGLLLFSLASAGHADDDLGRTGPYVGLAGVWALEQFEGLDADDGVGFDMRGGYRFHPNLAAELQLEWVPEWDAGAAEVETVLLTLNGKAFLATGRLQPYFLAGLGGLYGALDGPFGVDVDDSGFAARLGAGAEVYITPQIAAVLEGGYVFATGDVDELDYGFLVWGLQYRF